MPIWADLGLTSWKKKLHWKASKHLLHQDGVHHFSPWFHRGFTVVHLAEKLINSVAHKDAISALSGMMKMEAILSHVVLLATSNRHRHKTQTLKFGTFCTERADNFMIC